MANKTLSESEKICFVLIKRHISWNEYLYSENLKYEARNEQLMNTIEVLNKKDKESKATIDFLNKKIEELEAASTKNITNNHISTKSSPAPTATTTLNQTNCEIINDNNNSASIPVTVLPPSNGVDLVSNTTTNQHIFTQHYQPNTVYQQYPSYTHHILPQHPHHHQQTFQHHHQQQQPIQQQHHLQQQQPIQQQQQYPPVWSYDVVQD